MIVPLLSLQIKEELIMKILIKGILAIVLMTLIYSCENSKEDFIKIDEVSPWCILGFDSLERTPEQRIAMLNELGLKKYGFNRGKGEFDAMKHEFKLAKENDIEITSVFLWLNAKRDSLGKLSEANQLLLKTLKEVEQKPTVWVSFSDNYFKELSEEESISLSVEMINYVKTIVDEIGCELAIYNHHGWFGNPYNQLKILTALNQKDISMAYNFHHAHEYVDEFCEIAKDIKPYLSYVNLNGVEKDGEQILPIGKGSHEFEMVKCLKEQGYDGPWGILGHIKTEDVRKVLEGNIEGLEKLNALTEF